MEIKSISNKIFKTASKTNENQTNQSNHTNPFGVNFKGKMITADVFDSSEKSEVSFAGNIASKVAGKSKLITSTFIGAMGNLSNSISGTLNKAVNTFKNAGKSINRVWNYLNDTNVSISFDLVKRSSRRLADIYTDNKVYNVSELLKKNPLDYIGPKFKDAVAVKEAALA